MSARRPRGEAVGGSLDTLSSACYTIPWRPRNKSRRGTNSDQHSNQQPPFPILAEFEADSDPSRVRYASYQIAIQRTEALFERCLDDVYSSLFQDLRAFFKTTKASPHSRKGSGLAQPSIADQHLFLPGFESSVQTSTDSGAAKSIQTALLISTSAPKLSSFSARLVNEISGASTDGPASIVVTLSASECSNLYTALRLLVARFIAQGSTLGDQGQGLSEVEAAAFAAKVEPDLHVLLSWWQRKFGHSNHRPRLVVNLPTIESVEPTVLSDLLSSLQTFIAEPAGEPGLSTPQLLLVLGITSPSGGLASVSANGVGSSSSSASAPAPWIDYIPRSVLRVLDISRFSLPNKEAVWSRLVQSFLLSRSLPLSLGPSTFEYIRETYWERDADLDSLLDAVRLAYFIHFSGKPESVFTIPGQAKSVKFFSWTPKMVERIKIAFLTTDNNGDLVLPLLTDAEQGATFDVNAFLAEAARSDQFILGELDGLRHPREVLGFRLEFAVRFVFKAFEALQRIQLRASSAAQAMHARNASVAAQQAAEMDEQRQLERASEILTQVVMQCLNASVGALEAGRRVPAALTLRNGLARLCNAARRLLSDEFETLLDDMVSAAEEEVRRVEEGMGLDDENEVRETGGVRSAAVCIAEQSAQFLAGLRTFQQRLAQTIAAGTAGIKENDEADIGAAAANGTDGAHAAQQRREARLERVERKLVMEEKLLGLKREITDWIVDSVHDLADWRHLTRTFSSDDNGPLHLLRDIFWVDCYGALSTLLDASTRAGLTLPLAQPVEFVESLYDAALSVVPEEELEGVDLEKVKSLEVPDVCRMYGLYRECGKFVNLADWYEAFIVDSIRNDLQRPSEEADEEVAEAEAETGSKPKKRARTAAGGGKDAAETAREAEMQSRFALALNQLARMGMIRGTRRRQEHITKVMWDLVPDSF